ncbi:sigma-70 family RNA polymerase sigma factor [Leptospira sp. 2 VSF19]|uniref:Sigma-70 family RNA polymerase sigma factor n=1 Tax=Leptospira soteropolitanensis TaxID=2950025 RepID=A0AAW5VKW5_9LEPT|nr:sigma-70 family RNA polymerase sigma factor [Leptospira soteropolitanensis]MCW7494422.1 sigma-70 family RNA polymerase sigma factor [Leptospira soteropolitanensis]MCW7502017.1 sigma-70 family RNA polymerase sigma factor [Leptospira soteropolitanensis]MCW7524268.1 sigma-70 family RNA polymerase sigma factor [Leptospira soteropolitanensis]MCW7528133.1 sigma-70 family RNA polymerase sigma factor [Leptospira soteropolitanensis]MCW7531987.1 sigma-70 family RNA polymerase sigma factor [Leptospira
MKDNSYLELLDLTKSGNLRAWTDLQNRFSHFANQFAYKILKDADLSQDVVQESFWDLYQNLEKITTPEAFPSLLKRTVIKHVDRILRKKESQNLVFVDPIQIEQNSGGLDVSYLEKECIETIEQNVKKLEPEDQKLIELYYYQNYSLVEISKSEGKSLSFIKKRHTRVKRILRIGIGETFRPEANLNLMIAA